MTKTRRITPRLAVRPDDGRRRNRGVEGNSGGGRPPKKKTLLLNGVLQDGHWRIVDVTSETIALESIDSEQTDRTRP